MDRGSGGWDEGKYKNASNGGLDDGVCGLGKKQTIEESASWQAAHDISVRLSCKYEERQR